MNIAEFALQPDIEKLVLVEIQVGRKLQTQTWTQCGSPNTNVWYIALANDGEVVRVEEDGSAYTEKFTIALCHATTSTFYYNDLNKTLYIHTSGSDNPAILSGDDPKYNIVAFWWEYFSNRPKPLQPYSYKYGMFLYGANPKYGQHTIAPYEDILKEANGTLEFWTTATNVEGWTEAIGAGSAITKESTEVCNSRSAYSCKFVSTGNQCEISRADIILKPDRKARIRLQHKESATGKTIRIMLRDSGSNTYLNSSGEWQAGAAWIVIPNATAWTVFDLDFITHADYSQYSLYIRENDITTAAAYVDNIEVWRYQRTVDCHNFLPQGAIPSVSQSVGDYHQPDEQISFGVTKINNIDGWFYSRRQEEGYLWHGKEIRLRVGRIDENYNDLALFFTGITRKPVWGNVVEIDVKDERVLFQKIPLTRFDSTSYPNVEDAYANKPVPIALGGPIYDVPLPQSNTSTKKFKLSETSFEGTTYACMSVTNVYKNGTLLTLTTDYTVDLTNGEITLVTSWASGDVITAQFGGIDIDFFGDSDHPYLPANWFYFLYVLLNGVSKYRLNIASIVALNTNRKLNVAKWIADETDSLDFLIELKKTSIVQTYVGLDGTINFVYYTADVASDAPHYYNEDYIEKPRFEEDTDQTFKEVAVRSQYHYNDAYYRYEEEASEDQTEWNHKEKTRLLFETMLTTQFQAQDLSGNFASMVKDPIEVMEVTLPSSALLLNPTDKIYISYSEKDDDENEITIYDDEVFRILSLEKDLNTGHVQVRAIKDVSDFFWTIT